MVCDGAGRSVDRKSQQEWGAFFYRSVYGAQAGEGTVSYGPPDCR